MVRLRGATADILCAPVVVDGVDVVDAGTLYVAPLSTAEPDMTVRDGVFATDWPPLWAKLGPCDLWIDYDMPRDLYTIRADPEGRGFTDRLREVVGLGMRFMLGFQSADRTIRYVFPQVGNVKAIIRRHSPSLWEFTAERQNGLREAMTAYVAGHAQAMLPPTTPGPVGAPWAKPSTLYGGEAVELVPGRLRGFREWDLVSGVDGAPPRLAAITARTIWPWTPAVEARCHRNDIASTQRYSLGRITEHDPEDVPAAHCTCGFYAKHRPDPASIGQPRIAGVIEAWGKVEVGERGFRARYARLVALSDGARQKAFGQPSVYHRAADDETLAALGKLYRVPVFASEEAMWAEFPPVDVSALTGRTGAPPCPGCEANQRGDYAMHAPTCPRWPGPYRNHVHVSFAVGGSIPVSRWPKVNHLGA